MAIDDTVLRVYPAPGAQQTDIFFDAGTYSAFPHLAMLDGEEMIVAFRQAPREAVVRHTHPRSVITVMRSYDLGRSWDGEGSAQLAAGGVQEFSLLYAGGGRVVGALAKHHVVSLGEGARAGFPSQRHEYPYRLAGAYWAWSENHGLTWRLEDVRLVEPGTMPSSATIRLNDGSILMATYGSPSVPVCSAFAHRTTDGGVTWSKPVVMAEGSERTRVYQEPAVVELEPGRILALHRTDQNKVDNPGIFWRNESDDCGRSWTQPEETGIFSGACPRLLKAADGRIVLTFGRRRKPFGVRAMISSDGGRTWGDTAWVLREAANGNQGYTSSLQLADGSMFTACYGENDAGVTGIVGTFWRLP